MSAPTPRQAQVLGLLCKGLTALEIAERLRINRQTVGSYMDRLRLLYGCQTTAQLCYKAGLAKAQQRPRGPA